MGAAGPAASPQSDERERVATSFGWKGIALGANGLNELEKAIDTVEHANTVTLNPNILLKLGKFHLDSEDRSKAMKAEIESMNADIGAMKADIGAMKDLLKGLSERPLHTAQT